MEGKLVLLEILKREPACNVTRINRRTVLYCSGRIKEQLTPKLLVELGKELPALLVDRTTAKDDRTVEKLKQELTSAVDRIKR